MLILRIILLTSVVVKECCTQSHAFIPPDRANFCPENSDIYARFYRRNVGYDVIINNLKAATFITMKLDSIGTIATCQSYKEVQYTSEADLVNNIYSFIVLEDPDPEFPLSFNVKGKDFPHQPPYVVSVKINGVENCRNPNRTYFEEYQYVAKYLPDAPDKFCGRRKVNKESIPLIVSGSVTKAGHWPWHAAINKLTLGFLNYKCGGTLISNYVVLTAAHCVTVRGVRVNPEFLGVVLGKYSLHRIENTNQDREVSEVIVHDEYYEDSKNNDIALLKLSTEAIFNNFVQPACIWFDGIYDHLPSFEITGTVVGWGLDQSDILSKNLRTATLPIVPDITCIRYEPIYYTSVLNGKKFCAGNSNGTSACNGDSGGGFFVFVEDDKNQKYINEVPIEERPGAWYIKGIVSATLARKDANICDPNAYTVYTDVAQYRDWIVTNMR